MPPSPESPPEISTDIKRILVTLPPAAATTVMMMPPKIFTWVDPGISMPRMAVNSGRISARAYKTQNGEPRASMEVSVDDFEFLSPREQGGEFKPVQDEDLPWEAMK